MVEFIASLGRWLAFRARCRTNLRRIAHRDRPIVESNEILVRGRLIVMTVVFLYMLGLGR